VRTALGRLGAWREHEPTVPGLEPTSIRVPPLTCGLLLVWSGNVLMELRARPLAGIGLGQRLAKNGLPGDRASTVQRVGMRGIGAECRAVDSGCLGRGASLRTQESGGRFRPGPRRSPGRAHPGPRRLRRGPRARCQRCLGMGERRCWRGGAGSARTRVPRRSAKLRLRG